MKEHALHIVLHEPEIPQNTGNIARTCAAIGATLHLIEPLGFSVDERAVRRAGLDYWDQVSVKTYSSWEVFSSAQEKRCHNWFSQAYCLTTKGYHNYTEPSYPEMTWLIFGKETKGLPVEIIDRAADRAIRIPMRADSRSLNLSNAVAVCGFEVFRQWGWPGLALTRYGDNT